MSGRRGRVVGLDRAARGGRPRTRAAAATLAALLALVLPAVAAGGTPPRPAICKLSAQRAIAHHLAISAAAIAYRHTTGNNAMPQCIFRAHARGRRITVIANVDNGPQPYFRLLRTVDEASQVFGPPPPHFHPPQGVAGLGPFASWFPSNQWLMATNRKVLVTLSVDWPGATRDQKVALAKAAIEPYLPHVRGGKAEDFP